MQSSLDTAYIVLLCVAAWWWLRRGRHLAVQYLVPRSFWAGLWGRIFGLLILFTVASWTRSFLLDLLPR